MELSFYSIQISSSVWLRVMFKSLIYCKTDPLTWNNTNIHFTLKKNPMQRQDLKDFIQCYNPQNRYDRQETWSDANPEGRWRKFTYEELMARAKTSLDIFWLRDKSLTDLDNLPDPDVLALEIVENLESGLESFRAIATGLQAG